MEDADVEAEVVKEVLKKPEIHIWIRALTPNIFAVEAKIEAGIAEDEAKGVVEDRATNKCKITSRKSARATISTTETVFKSYCLQKAV